MAKSDERLPAELSALAEQARTELVDFLGASRRKDVTPAEVEERLSLSVWLKDAVSSESRH